MSTVRSNPSASERESEFPLAISNNQVRDKGRTARSPRRWKKPNGLVRSNLLQPANRVKHTRPHIEPCTAAQIKRQAEYSLEAVGLLQKHQHKQSMRKRRAGEAGSKAERITRS